MTQAQVHESLSGGTVERKLYKRSRCVEQLLHKWTSQIAEAIWSNEGKPRGRAEEHWWRAEAILQDKLASLGRQHLESLSEEQCIQLAAQPIDRALTVFLDRVKGPPGDRRINILRVHQPDAEQDAPAGMVADSKEADMDPANAPLPADLKMTLDSTRDQHISAARNRDALTLMSRDDRQRFAGRYAVVVRVGDSVGAVIGSGSTSNEAIQEAERHPGYRPTDCSVRYITPPGQHPVALAQAQTR